MGGELPYTWSPLFPAARAVDPDRTRRFLAMGIDPHLRGEYGNALSIVTCTWPRKERPPGEREERAREVVRLLLEAGVDPNVPNKGRTPLHCAENSNDPELAATLEAAGARSRESLWRIVKRGATRAAVVLAILIGGGM